MSAIAYRTRSKKRKVGQRVAHTQSNSNASARSKIGKGNGNKRKNYAESGCCIVSSIAMLNLFVMFTLMGIRIGYIRHTKGPKNLEPNPYDGACTVFSIIALLLGVFEIWYYKFDGKKDLEFDLKVKQLKEQKKRT